MIKRTITYAAIALLTLGFTACQQEEDFAPQGGGEQELRIATRSTTYEGTKTPFTDDFTLVLCKRGNRQNIETHEMSFSDNGWNVVLSKALPAIAFAYKGMGVDFYDYDYNQGWSYHITLQTDQSTPQKLKDADVMTATSNDVWATTSLELDFKHYFAKVTFKVTYANEYNGNYPELTDINFFEISCFLNEENADNNKIEVITDPAWIASGTIPVLSLKVNGVPNVVRLNEGITLEAGVNHIYNLKIGKDTVTLTPAGTSTDFPGGWDNEEKL